MATYAVIYDLKIDSTHRQRRDSLKEQLYRATSWWDGASSFAIVRSSEAIDSLLIRLYRDSKIVDLKDFVLVVDLDTQDARARGPIPNPQALKLLLPRLQMLTPG